MILLVLHFEISGTDNKDEQLESKPIIFITQLTYSLIFHFDISGKDNKDEQSENEYRISVRLLVFHFEISGKDDKNEQL